MAETPGFTYDEATGELRFELGNAADDVRLAYLLTGNVYFRLCDNPPRVEFFDESRVTFKGAR